MFKEIKSVNVPEYDGVATMYRHDCGMEVLHIKNSSEECSAVFMFTTESEDNTGVAHILEHTVLAGSERFPVKDPFSQLFLTSPNTFLNAMTFPDKTIYPFASPLKKDFDIIFDIYADAVFAPLLRKETFHQEGVRFCGDKIDGVVFNEMCGAFSSEDAFVSRFSAKKLFEGTPAEFESGGDPRYIPDLTYEEYLARYKKWYSPANCRMFLYGNLDAKEYMDKIESRYLTEEKLKKISHAHLESPSEKYMHQKAVPQRDVQMCPTKDASSVVLNWLTTESNDPFEILTLSVLTDILLGNPGAPLYKAITDSGLGEDLSPCSGMETDYPVLTFSVGYTGAKKDSENEIEDFILKTLTKLATEGIEESQKKACMKRQKFKLQEIPGEGYPYGILVALRASRFWLRGKDPIEGINNLKMFERLEKEYAKGNFFENWIMKNLVNNPKRCLLSVKEDSEYDAKLKQLLTDKYNALRKGCGDEQFAKEREVFEAFVNTPDTPENLAKIPRITKADLPEQIPLFALKKMENNEADIRYMNTFTRGISYINFAFDTVSLSEDELKLLPLFTRVMQMCGTKKHTYPEVGVLIKMLTGSFSMNISCGTRHDGKPSSYFVVRSSALTEDVPDALDFIKELLLEADLKDTERISASVTDFITDFESDYTYSANAYSFFYSMASLSHSGKINDTFIGTTGYLAIKEYQNASKEKLEELSHKLEALREKIICKSKMVANYCCDKQDNSRVGNQLAESIAAYPAGKKEAVADFYNTEFTPSYNHKVLAVSGGPAYNSSATPLSFDNERDLVCANLAASIFNAGYMFEQIRGKGGAYGAGSHVDMAEKVLLCWSYRDPNVEKTFDWFESAFESNLEQKDIDYTIAAIIGKELRPYVPKAKNFEAFKRSLSLLSDELYLERRKNLLSLSLDEVKQMCKKIRTLMDQGSAKTTICGKEMVKPEYDDVLTLAI